MKRIFVSLFVIGVVAATAISASRAFFSDTETSSGNVLSAGSIDLKISNTARASNPHNPQSWAFTDLTSEKFFNFTDLKPGDWEVDTVGIDIVDNDAWMCANIQITDNSDNGITEPEDEMFGANNDQDDGTPLGDLASEIKFRFWVETDGTNNRYDGETIFMQGTLADILNGATYALADTSGNALFGNSPMSGATNRYIGKAFCYGDWTENGDGNGPGFGCNGQNVTNLSQSDRVLGDISFYVTQSRNQDGFVCSSSLFPQSEVIAVGAKLSEYTAPTCTTTVSGSSSIQAAVTGATAGSIICVDSTYNSEGDTFPIIVDKNLTLAGLGSAGSAVLDGGIRVDANDVTITGLEIHDTNFAGEVAAIYQNSGVDNTIVSYNELAGPGTSTGQGLINVYNASNPNSGLQFRHNVSFGWLRGIYQNPSANVIIEYNDLVNNGVGSANDGPNDNVIHYNDIQDNTLEAVGYDGSPVHGGNGNLDVNFNNLTSTVAVGNDVNYYGSGPVLNAENNWWGDTDPSNDVNGVNVDYDPYASFAYAEN